MFKALRKSEKGFTLIELLIVVAIIGILAAIAIPQFAAYRQRAYNSATLSDINNLQKTQQAFFDDFTTFGAMGATTGGGTSTPQLANGTNTMPLGLSNQVRMEVVTGTGGAAFNATAKHTQGTRVYGVDSDATVVYFQPGTAGATLAVSPPAATTGTDFALSTWTVL